MKLSDAVKLLADAGIEDARYEARELFMYFGGYKKHELILSDPDCTADDLISAINKRVLRVPLQYIIGSVGFYNEEYEVSDACLIPRQDTEILVDYAVKNIPDGERFLDACTGSGCVGISTLKNTVGTTALLVDLSLDALKIAKRNAEKNGVLDRAEFCSADLLSEIADGEYFAVLSNPPYVTESAYESLEREIYYEPKMAFVGGRDGLDFYRRLTSVYKSRIKAKGFIAYEIGYDQGQALREIAESENMTCEIIKDLSGNDRVAVLRLFK